MLTRKMIVLVGALVYLVAGSRAQAVVSEDYVWTGYSEESLERKAQAFNGPELPVGLIAGEEWDKVPGGVDALEGPAYKEGELIVKFKKPISDTLEQQLAEKVEPKGLRLSTSLDTLNRKYNVMDIKPVIKNFKAKRQRIENLLKKDKKLLTKREKHMVRRLRRAPKGAKVPELDRIYMVKLEPGQSAEQAVSDYSKDPAVEYAELNYIVSICLTPNDPNYPQQWALNNTGQMYPASGSYREPPGTAGCDINAPEAWDIHTGSSEVVVAVIDTGVNYDHRDLQGNMWVNTDEIPGDSLDNDENGYIDDFYGYDFCQYGQSRDSDPVDDMGHGTHCAGIIAADGNNGLDITGVSWNSKIMAVKFLGSGGSGYVTDGADAIEYATDSGADILSNSWRSPDSNAVRDAIEYAVSQGAIVVASAGNDNSSSPHYPADYNDVISVAATDSNDDKASFSNYGDWVDIAAPGVDILSLRPFLTVMGTPYGKKLTVASGTSMACPHVSGACALLLSVNSYLTLDDVNEILTENTDELDNPNICASGRLNVHKAMLGAISSKGYINLDRPSYGCDTNVGILLSDLDLAAEPNQIVTISTDGNDSETVDLNEIGLDIGVFTGSIATESGDPCIGDGILQVSGGETIMVVYQDINIGDGNSAEPNDTATVDCVVPIISNVSFSEPLVGQEQVVTFQTSKLTTARVICGTSCGEPNIVAEYLNPQLSHTIKFKGMAPLTDYYFKIEATDLSGNTATDSNSGNCYWFVTDEGPRDINVPGEYNTIQQAIDAAWDGSTIWLADGTYTGTGNRNVDFKGRGVTLRSANGPNSCIIDCQNLSRTRAFIFQNEEEATSVLQGLTITNGNMMTGGAIMIKVSSPRIEGCVFRGNQGTQGGAVYNLYGAPEINNCTFTENQTSGAGGAIRDGGGQLTITHCLFSENTASLGGAIYALFTDLLLDDCTFSENMAGHGGATFLTGEHATVTDCTFLSNSSSGKGGGIYNQSWLSGQIIFQAINCTFSGNIAGSYGGGICNGYNNNSTVINCILWGNDANDMNEIANLYGGVTNISYSDIEGCGGSGAGWDTSVGTDYGGNIDADPCFVDDPNDPNNYHLSSDSPCIDAGDPCFVSDPNETDIDGQRRVMGEGVDMGADEYEQIPEDPHKFRIKNNSDETVAWFGNLGNLVLKGTLTSGETIDTAPDNSFVIADSTGDIAAYVDNEGNLCIEGAWSELCESCNPTTDAFIIKNSSDDKVSYIEFDGDLCLTGGLYPNSNP